MRLYLDNNVLARVQELGEEAELTAWVSDHRHQLVISDVHLLEALPISDRVVRDRRLDLLVSLRAKSHNPRPVGYVEAKEYIAEVQRCRPRWIEPYPRLSESNRHLAAARRRWIAAKRERQALVANYASTYASVAEPAIGRARISQKQGRQLRRDGADKITGFGLANRMVGIHPPLAEDDVVGTFAITAIASWYLALYTDEESVRDYRDYAAPYLRRGIQLTEFIRFWLSDLEARRLPRNLAAHIVAHEQLNAKITHGNAQDQNHAAYVVDADAFVTADKAFFDALQRVLDLVPGAAEPKFVAREAPSMVAQLSAL